MIRERIEIIKGDITELRVDAIVNAANATLMGGGGVDGAIHRIGGPAILEECRKIIDKIGSCDAGRAVITTAGHLPSKWVIHTVGPVWHNGKQREAHLLTDCYRNSLKLAADKGLETLAFPNVSTGAYLYPKDEAAAIAVHTVIDFLHENQLPRKVILCCFDNENYNWMSYYLQQYLSQE